MIHRLHFRVFADYHQFYLWDPNASGQLAPEEWSEDDVAARAKVADHVFVVSPVRNMEVPLTVEIHDADPGFQAAEWGHIVEASVDFPSGKLEVHECTGGSHCEISVEPGIYRIRALYKGLASLTDDGLDGQDSYLVTLWRGDRRRLQVIKEYSG